MIRTAALAAAVAALVVGGWGCTQSPGQLASANAAATAARAQAVRLTQLEAELTALKAAQGKQAADAAAVLAELKAERTRAAGLVTERDELRRSVADRAAERDAARGRLDGFRQELRELLARADGSSHAPATASLGAIPEQ